VTVVELQIGGLLGRTLTGPWMKILYRNAMNNLLTGAILKKVMEKLYASLTTPRLLRDSTFQIFETNSRGSEERSIYSPEPNALALELTELVIGEIVKVLERHLARYLTSDLSNPTSELLSLTTNSTTDTIAAESFLGLADSLARKAPNATYAHILSKTMFSMNRTQSFLWEREVDNLVFQPRRPTSSPKPP